MSGAGGPISGPCAAGPEAAPVRPARVRSGSPGFIDQDAAKRNGFSNRGACQNTGPLPHGTSPPDLAARAVGLELKGPPGDGPDDVNNPSDPTTAGDEGRRRSRARARGRANGPLRLCKRDGGRCRARAQEGYAHCYNHREDLREARAAAASRGGRAGGNGRAGDPRLAGREIGALKRQLQRIADGVLDGAVLHGQAAVAVQALNAKARVLELERRWREIGEVEEKLQDLERRLKALGQSS